jgi:hypothetical protein
MKIDWKEAAIGFAMVVFLFFIAVVAFAALRHVYESTTEPPRHYTVIDHSGREWHGLTRVHDGLHGSVYRDSEGRRYRFRGNVSAIEEATKN